jgi:hypothetical protein
MRVGPFFFATTVLAAWSLAALAEHPVDPEQQRLRAHFERVDEELRLADNSQLTPGAATKRAMLIAELARYADAGVFPLNSSHPGERRPYFVDDEGRTCAMAHLMLSTGHTEEVVAVAATQNNAYLHDMHSAALELWLDGHGLSLEEAALIQPSYCSCPPDERPVCTSDGTSHLNECVATLCAGGTVVACGLCAGDSDIESWPATDGQLTIDEYCAERPCVCIPGGGAGGDAAGEAPPEGDIVVEQGCSLPARIGGRAWPSLLLLGLLVARRRLRGSSPLRRGTRRPRR